MELKLILAIFVRHKRLIRNIIAGVVLIFVVLTLLVEPRYVTKARVYLRKSPASNIFFNATGSLASVDSQVEETERYNYLAVATSLPVMEKVINDLQLTRSRKIVQLFEMIPFASAAFNAMGIQRSSKAMLPSELRQKELIAFFFPRPLVSVKQFEDTDVLEITASYATLDGSIALANAVASAFIFQLGEMQQADFIRLQKVAEEAVPIAEERLKGAQAQVQHFKKQCGYVDITTYTTQLVDKITTIRGRIEENGLLLAGARSKLVAIQADLDNRPEFRKTSIEFERNPTIDTLQTSLQTLYLNLAEARTQYTDKHPVVATYEVQLADIKKRMQEETEKIFSSDTLTTDTVFETLTSSFSEVTVAIANYESIIAADRELLATYEHKLHLLPETAATYARLSAAVTAAEAFYTTLLTSLERLKTAERIHYSDVTLLDPAVYPATHWKAKYPKLFGKLAIGLILGTILGLGAGLLVEYLDETVRDLASLAEEMEMLDLGGVPLFSDADNLIRNADMPPLLREAMRRVVVRLRQYTAGQLAGGILLSSPGRGEGKVFVGACLGRTLAMLGQRTLLVDGDMHEPHLHTALGIDNGVGFADCLEGGAHLEQVAREFCPNFDVVTAGRVSADPCRWVDSPALETFLTVARQRYDVVLVTSPPLNEVVDAAVYVPRFDMCFIIAAYGCTERSHYLAAARALSPAGSLRVALLNKVLPIVHHKYQGHRSSSTVFANFLSGMKNRYGRA
ncbi:MAG: hypothetical protein BWK73_48505 [Thiothrix lacustris]|uniref:Polysaccharide chain length determinant N-terminal domain-containing protein n=1 Tax=Thiothrix lacustris TaxID=525917 RepID=A0A1Y1Q9B4_9GAMM|nr:MAG: hypothetical protein BWK73_48505 [Thiothrix lacustris]